VGTSVAYELACGGAGVTVVDGALPGRASDAGAGILSPETFHDPDPTWFAFGLEAARHVDSLVDRLVADGADPGPDAFARCGSLVVALAGHEEPWFAEVAALAAGRAPDVDEIAADDARALFPPLAPVTRALHNPAAARVDGRRLGGALRSAARRRGVRFVVAEAVGLERDRERVSAVRTAQGSVPCGAVVLAGGAWSARAAAWAGVRLPVAPTKGQIVHVVLPPDVGPGAARSPSASWAIVQPVLNFYLVPWPGGRVACGGTFEPAAGFDVRPTAAGLRDLLRECVTIAPGLAEATFVEVRVGLRPTTGDDRPVLGPLPGTANVQVCTGHGANGLLLGPYSGALVAHAVLGRHRAPPGGAGGRLDPLVVYGAARFT